MKHQFPLCALGKYPVSYYGSVIKRSYFEDELFMTLFYKMVAADKLISSNFLLFR